jgi:hypothetical protein
MMAPCRSQRAGITNPVHRLRHVSFTPGMTRFPDWTPGMRRNCLKVSII